MNLRVVEKESVALGLKILAGNQNGCRLKPRKDWSMDRALEQDTLPQVAPQGTFHNKRIVNCSGWNRQLNDKRV